MKLMNSVVIATGLVLALVSPTMAQQRQRAPIGVYVGALGGASFGPQTAASFGVEFGERIHENGQAYAVLSYFEDLMDSSLRGDLAQLGQLLTTTTGRTWDLQGRDRGVALIMGAKYVGGSAGVRPYVGGGAGALNLRRHVTERQVGDVTAAAFSEFGIGDSGLAEGVTRPLVEATAGVGIEIGRAHLDVGYRYRRAFQLSRKVDFSQLAVGIGVNF